MAAAAPPAPDLGADRALLAALLSVIPKARRQGLRLLVTPDTILRWHRDIVRCRWAARSKRGRTGRPATRRNIKALVLRLARANPEWGYRRIHGELAGLGVKVVASTVWQILKADGIGPAPRRTGPTWPQFLRSQAEAILACDFFTAGLLDGTQAHVLTVIDRALAVVTFNQTRQRSPESGCERPCKVQTYLACRSRDGRESAGSGWRDGADTEGDLAVGLLPTGEFAS